MKNDDDGSSSIIIIKLPMLFWYAALNLLVSNLSSTVFVPSWSSSLPYHYYSTTSWFLSLPFLPNIKFVADLYCILKKSLSSLIISIIIITIIVFLSDSSVVFDDVSFFFLFRCNSNHSFKVFGKGILKKNTVHYPPLPPLLVLLVLPLLLEF